MIGPLSQFPLPPASDKLVPDQPPGSDVFAQILASSGTVAPPLPGPPPVPDHGPAIVRLLIESEASVLDPALPPEVGPREAVTPVAAEVFNQDGFFGTPVTSDSVQQMDARAGEVLASRQILEAEAVPVPTAHLEAASSFAVEAGAGVSGPAPAPHLPRAPQIVPSAAPAHIAMSARAVPEAIEAAEPTEPVARRFTLREAAARSAVQVALHDLEQGLHINARTDALDASERVRLHDEIAALLARHGLSARAIRITAPDRSAHSQEKFK